MARSSYIYFISQNDFPIAGFTVKYEMTDYFEFLKDKSNLRFFRMPDNPRYNHGKPTEITEEYIK